MMKPANFTFRYYFRVMTQLLSRPRDFFSTYPLDGGWKRPMLVLVVSSTLYTAACMISRMPTDPLKWGSVLFINALGMVMITAAMGFTAMVIVSGKRVTFGSFFSIYALSSSAALLLSWMPFTVWIAEIYKWWLIGTGLTRSVGIKTWNAVLVVSASIIGVVGMFQLVLFFVAARSG